MLVAPRYRLLPEPHPRLILQRRRCRQSARIRDPLRAAGAAADHLLPVNFVIIDELGCLPFRRPARARLQLARACDRLRLYLRMGLRRTGHDL